MSNSLQHIRATVLTIAVAALGAGSGAAMAASQKLTGDQEVPPVSASGSGDGSIAVAADGAVSGEVKTTGVNGTMAHIHMAPAGKNGPVVIPLTKGGDGSTWSVPAGAKLTPDQMKSYQAGDLYVNVHTDANKGGEIRAQLKP
jgi:hypothetical protein